MPLAKPSERGVVVARQAHRFPGRGSVAIEDSDDETEMSEDLVSLIGSDHTASANGDSNNQLSAFWDTHTEQKEMMRSLMEFSNRQTLPEETNLMIRQFERASDVPFHRTYQMGKAVREVIGSTHTPQIGLVVLPGADLPEVNRLEQTGMVSVAPEQRNAMWRVNTAGSLLSNISVAPDLALVTHDVTSNVAANAHRRLEKADPQSRSHHSFSRNAVTIASENVEIVHDFAQASKELDLSATLIEVNMSSLWTLMTEFKNIILNSGPEMTFDSTKDLLERMIEAARRFCVRSPILFRMSTRTKIISSNNTRYGVDNEYSFQTFTTSKGIQEIIMMSASYFSALDPSAPGMDKDTQRIIRPKFLQMLTLLLSLLNDYDLKVMSDFIERTFRISSSRTDMELLFLKVIPLTSINSKVFLQGLVPAVDQWSLSEKALRDEPLIWKNFMKRLARKGYLLPSSVEDLGHRNESWVPSWPHDGIHSSTIFSRLQYHGETSSTFNEIPTARFSYEPELTELTVLMTNAETYTIHPADYEQIARLTKGLYTVTKPDNSIGDLDISETVINGSINEAIQVINDAIRRFNSNAGALQRQKSRKWPFKPRPWEPRVFPDVDAASRLTRNQATLDNQILAVAYKLNGRSVPKTEATRYMSSSYTRVKTLFNRLCDAAGPNSLVYYAKHIETVNQLLATDRKVRQTEIQQQLISDAPIVRAFGPDDAEMLSMRIWYDYQVDLVENPQSAQDLLQIKAKADYVASVNWRKPGQQAEIMLVDTPTRFFVAPLKPVPETQQNDEITVGDLVLLVGRYFVVATLQHNDFSYPLVMTNWLEIQEAHSQEVGRRGRNYQAKEKHQAYRFV